MKYPFKPTVSELVEKGSSNFADDVAKEAAKLKPIPKGLPWLPWLGKALGLLGFLLDSTPAGAPNLSDIDWINLPRIGIGDPELPGNYYVPKGGIRLPGNEGYEDSICEYAEEIYLPTILGREIPLNISSKQLTLKEIEEIVKEIGNSIADHPLRIEYEEKVRELIELEKQLIEKGLNKEEIARKLNEARRELGVEYKDLSPELLREYIYEINKERYGDPLGPTYDLKNVQEKTDEKIIESAKRPNGDINKLLEKFEEWLRQKNGI